MGSSKKSCFKWILGRVVQVALVLSIISLVLLSVINYHSFRYQLASFRSNLKVIASSITPEFNSQSNLKTLSKIEANYWNSISAETMQPQQITDYLKWTNRGACDVIHYFGGLVQQWIPRGVDGSYAVCIDSAVKLPDSNNCLVYSFGVNGDWTFDEAMEQYGCQIYSFDPSMNLSDHDHSPRIHFYNLGLSDRDFVDFNGWTLKTLDSIYQMLLPRHGGKIIDYLKIDIEWNEWDVLKQVLQSGMLDKVRQLSVEFHLPNKRSSEDSSSPYLSVKDYRSFIGVIKSIEDRMTRFESRINPWMKRNIKTLNYDGPICFDISFYQVLPYEDN